MSSYEVVKWSYHSGGPYLYTSFATTKTHSVDDLCGEPATKHGYYPPFYWHYGIITNISYPDIIYYVYGDSSSNIWSKEESFRALPLTSSGSNDNVDTVVMILHKDDINVYGET